MEKSTLLLWIIFLGMLLVLITQVDAVGYCPSFCDPNGYYHEPHHCHAPEVYCCGTAFHRFCCSNKSYDISGYYPEKYNCNTNTWMQVHWQVMITMTGSVLLILLFSACCCQCCRICNERIGRERMVRFNSATSPNISSIVTDAEGNQFVSDSPEITAAAADGGQVSIQMFDPESPFAFTPPEYNSLPKDPPKYNDVFTASDGGNFNPCYIPDTPPPPFSETDAPTAPQLSALTPTMEEHATRELNPDATNEDSVVDNTDHGDILDGTPEIVMPDSNGFVDVDLSAEASDDLGLPLTSQNISAQHGIVQEEAREHCLNGDTDNRNDTNNLDR